MFSERIKPISVHVPTHLKPLGDKNLGHYLAGLIDGDGHVAKDRIKIVFYILDASLAYYIKKEIGFGVVKKIKGKNAVIYTLSNKEGIEKVLCLINGKIRSDNKLAQINRLLSQPRYSLLQSKIQEFKLNSSEDLNNYWLAGFADADASFQIKLLTRNEAKPRTEVRLAFQIDQKKDLSVLKKIKELFGGDIRYCKLEDLYYFTTTSFGSARKVIRYFDKYHLLSSKHVNYLKWRKTYILVQTQKHPSQ
jgi:hypothetical protein